MQDAHGGDMSTPLDRFVDRYVRTITDDNPVLSTYLGLHEHDHSLGDTSAEALDDRNRHVADLLSELDATEIPENDHEAVIDRQALRASLSYSIFQHEQLRSWQKSPSVYVGTALSGLNELIVGDFAPLEQRVSSLVGRLKDVPKVLRSMQENLRDVPRVYAKVGAEMARGGATFVSSVLPGLAEAAPKLRAELESAGPPAGETFSEAASHLEVVSSEADAPFHVGREHYDWILRRYHLLDLSAEELREIGKKALDETRREQEEVAREIDPERSVTEIVEELKASHPSASGLRDHYASEMARARDFVAKQGLVTIPENEVLEVIDTPVFFRKLFPYAAYHPAGPFEPRQRGLFYVTPVDESLPPDQQERQLRGHGVHTIPIIALHEAYPGHHLQLIRSNANPRKARKLLHNTVFIEGWALYCEEMMKQEGFYEDPRARLSQLKETVWRASRVVVDVGLQLGEMSVEEAVDFMVNEASLERISAEAEVKRYAGNPTQPSSYLVGKLAITDIRRRYEEREGAAFDLREFHDAVLDVGSIQPRLVEAALGLGH